MGNESSINSEFKFISYKVDKFNFKSLKRLDILGKNQSHDAWNFDLSFIQPMYSKSSKCFICGLNMKGFVSDPNDSKIKILEFDSEVTGLFQASGDMDIALRDSLVKIQGPAILLPYLRATITSYIAASGFGSIVIPLINIQKMALSASDKISIMEVE